MTNKTQVKSPILAAVHETARDLHRQGFISKRTMSRYDALCLEPIPAYNSEDIRTMREKPQRAEGGTLNGWRLE
jgi:putative transcriptional regulator